MKIDDDVVKSGMLGGKANHEEARWGEGVVATSWASEFPRGQPPSK